MKTMICGNVRCEVSVSEKFYFMSEVPCQYGRDIITYAVERYFPKSKELCRRCTYASWRQRTAKGTPTKERRSFVIPARRMELPGKWVRVSGKIDKYGFIADRVELLRKWLP